MQRLLSPLRQIGKPSSSTVSISPAESKFKVMVELILLQLVPLPTVPAVIETLLVGKLRVVLVAPLTTSEKAKLAPEVSIFRLALLFTRADCCTDLDNEISVSAAFRLSKPLGFTNLPKPRLPRIPNINITATSSTIENPFVLGRKKLIDSLPYGRSENAPVATVYLSFFPVVEDPAPT